MSLKVIRKTEQLTSKWTGGTTTQLYIYPENSTYQDRNFLFRISTATIETGESVFTSLPGISRQIMILEGSLKIEHKGRYTKILQKFETDSFEGDWETTGFGKATDFNLMTTGKVRSSIEVKSLKAGKSFKFRLVNPEQVFGFYPFKGKFTYETGNDSITLNEKEFLIAGFGRKILQAKITALLETEIIISKVYLPGG
jgi:environmental stress-induced protein Ves